MALQAVNGVTVSSLSMKTIEFKSQVGSRDSMIKMSRVTKSSDDPNVSVSVHLSSRCYKEDKSFGESIASSFSPTLLLCVFVVTPSHIDWMCGHPFLD
jgi:hypothetical protein